MSILHKRSFLNFPPDATAKYIAVAVCDEAVPREFKQNNPTGRKPHSPIKLSRPLVTALHLINVQMARTQFTNAVFHTNRIGALQSADYIGLYIINSWKRAIEFAKYAHGHRLHPSAGCSGK